MGFTIFCGIFFVFSLNIMCRILCTILLVPHNIFMDLNNVMFISKWASYFYFGGVWLGFATHCMFTF